MTLTFNESKATQAAGRMLERSGKPMNAMKLIRMLYLADREAILRWGHPITTDCFLFMKHGPVLSQVHQRVVEGDDPRKPPSQWNASISRPQQDGTVELRGPLEHHDLSDEELNLLDEIVQHHGARSEWELADLTQGLPEWRDPHGSVLPFGIQDILAAKRRSEPEVPGTEAETEEVYLNFRW